MAPRKQTPAPQAPAPTPTAQASVVTKTVQGFAIGLTAFIPIDPKDLRKQSEIPLLLLDIQEGKKTIADLANHLKQVEFRQQFTRKRVTGDEYNALFGTASAVVADHSGEGETQDDADDGDEARALALTATDPEEDDGLAQADTADEEE